MSVEKDHAINRFSIRPTSDSTYRPYPEYKPVDIGWLRQVPSHWDVRRLKLLASVELSSVDKKKSGDEQPVELCNYVDVYYNEFITREIDFMQGSASSEEIRRHQLQEDDVLITKDSETWDDIGVPAYVPKEITGVVCGYHLAQIRSQAGSVSGRYLFRQFQANAINEQLQIQANGITRYGLGKQDLKDSWFLVPSLEEQRAITAFLDRETGKIDALIEKKERLIELLEEKRAALITHAVTKGLDPDAPMKDSGVEWLGEIPEHWKIRRLKHISSVELSSVDKKKSADELPVKLCNYVDVYYHEYITDQIGFMEGTAIKHEVAEYGLHEGDVLITKDSETWDDIAIPAYVPSEMPGVVCGYHLAQIRADFQVLMGEFLFRQFQAERINEQLQVSANGIIRYGLGKQSLKDSWFILPPMQDQDAIVTFLRDETKKIDALEMKIDEAIDRLKEYRTALISAAVTGKIDVRD